jgi:hypothetical protein
VTNEPPAPPKPPEHPKPPKPSTKQEEKRPDYKPLRKKRKHPVVKPEPEIPKLKPQIPKIKPRIASIGLFRPSSASVAHDIRELL